MESAGERSSKLVKGIQAGSRSSWHSFVDGYSGLIFSVIRRYLSGFDTDDQRSLYVEILEKLYRGALDNYSGETRLSTWLFIFTRSRCLDFLRSRRGRRRLPDWMEDLPETDRKVYRMRFLHGMRSAEICERLSLNGTVFSLEDLADSLMRLEARVSPQTRKTLAYDLYAQSVGVASGRMLEFIQKARIDGELADGESRPDRRLEQEDRALAIDRVRECVRRLPEVERRVLDMRYKKGWTAKRVAEALGLRNPRLVYTVESRALRLLNKLFG